MQSFTTTLAYLDPGTGSIILQALIGSVVGGLYILKLYWGRITAFFSRNKDAAVDESEAQNDG